MKDGTQLETVNGGGYGAARTASKGLTAVRIRASTDGGVCAARRAPRETGGDATVRGSSAFASDIESQVIGAAGRS
jgi:hypothetical protein